MADSLIPKEAEHDVVREEIRGPIEQYLDAVVAKINAAHRGKNVLQFLGVEDHRIDAETGAVLPDSPPTYSPAMQAKWDATPHIEVKDEDLEKLRVQALAQYMLEGHQEDQSGREK